MRVRCLLPASVLLALLPMLAGHRLSSADDYRGPQAVRALFYNAENLFFPGSDSLNPDMEFSIQGSRYWNWNRYNNKINRIAQVILATGGWEAPALVGLCEIEGREVLFDLTRDSPLASADYRFIHKDSPDFRGIDVALLYRYEKVRILEREWLSVNISPGAEKIFSRDILYARALLLGRDTVSIFVNHWPSRRGGEVASRWKRKAAANEVLRYILRSVAPDEAVLLMGDFNDEPADSSLQLIMSDTIQDLRSLPLSATHHDVGGTLVFDPGTGKQWYRFDNILVSGNLLDGSSDVSADSALSVFSAPWILEQGETRDGMIPYRTYHGFQYREGYSDHLPVYIDLVRRK